jgi:hypothetical protein
MKLVLRVLFFLGVLQLFQCTSEEDSANSYIDGTWKAEWLLTDDSMKEMFSASEITMDGELIFNENNIVKITAYGFDGCVFASDTATNQLKYDFQDSLLHMINGEKEIVFSYQVKEKLPDQLTLLLMDDILLTLRR